MTRRPVAPTGWPPPEVASLDGVEIALGPLCEEIAARYFERFPEDLRRYGEDVARAWEIHDTRHVLRWAFGAVEGWLDLDRQIAWLAQVLESRSFPLEHLAANLDLCADVAAERLDGGERVAAPLRAAAAMVRRTPSFR